MTLCDSNILVYAYDSTSPYHLKAKRFLEEKTKIKGEIGITPQVLLEFFGVVTQKVKQPLNVETASELIKEIANNKNIVCLYPRQATYLRTLELAKKYKILGRDIFDAYLVATMLDNGVGLIYTRNLKDFEKFSEITALDPTKETKS